MAGCDVDPKQVLREIDALVDGFEALRLAKARGTLRTTREAIWSRTAPPKEAARLMQPPELELTRNVLTIIRMFCGVELSDVKPTTFEESQLAPVYYSRRTGVQMVNALGESQVFESGWSSLHGILLFGDDAQECIQAIERANAWIVRRQRIIEKALLQKHRVIIKSGCWPDIVLMIGERSDADATMTKPEWCVEIGCVELYSDADGTKRLRPLLERTADSMTVRWWMSRKSRDWKDLGQPEPYASIIEADELFIGDPPEVKYCEQELKPFLMDSELALGWLRRWIEDSMRDAIPSEPILSAELKQSDAPGDGLYETERCLIWGGVRYERLTDKMVEVLRVFVDRYDKGFPIVRVDSFNPPFDGGFIRQAFKLNRKGEPPIHKVAEAIEKVADGEYRLSDPGIKNRKVPE